MFTNLVLVFLFFWQAADPFAAVEKMLKGAAPALAERDAAFAQLKAAVNSGNLVDLAAAEARYSTASIAAAKVWLEAEAELTRAVKLATKDKPLDEKSKARLTQLFSRVAALIKNPPDYEEVMKKYRARLSGPSAR